MTNPIASWGMLTLTALLASCQKSPEANGAPSAPSAPTTAAEVPPSPASAPPVASAPPEPAAASSTAAASPSASAPDPAAPLPDVEVRNIGMHIGGGPNDAPTKQPIKESVQPHFDALRGCWSKVDDPKKAGDFGVDLLIPRQGGKAKVSLPRTAIKGDGFTDCVVAVFENIEFKKPRTGETMVSYSVRFTP